MPKSLMDVFAISSTRSLYRPNVTSITFCASVTSDRTSIDFFMPDIIAVMPPTTPIADSIPFFTCLICDTVLFNDAFSDFSAFGALNVFAVIFLMLVPSEFAAFTPLDPVLEKSASALVISIRFWLTLGALDSVPIILLSPSASFGIFVIAVPADALPRREMDLASSDICEICGLTDIPFS